MTVLEKRIIKQIDSPNVIKNRSKSIAYDFIQLLERKTETYVQST
jgi:hypothetical protein